MIRKTMRIGAIRTSIKLEQEFWSYLEEIAADRSLRLSALVNEVATASPERTNLASTLRTFALIHARLRWRAMHDELEKLTLAGNTQDLMRVMEACPLPCLILNAEREIRQLNKAFVHWLNVDAIGVVGQRLENIMILRGSGTREMWDRLFSGKASRSAFNATYVSPGKVRTSQALAVGLGAEANTDVRACLVLFETLAGRG